jgi:hypothetical protein
MTTILFLLLLCTVVIAKDYHSHVNMCSLSQHNQETCSRAQTSSNTLSPIQYEITVETDDFIPIILDIKINPETRSILVKTTDPILAIEGQTLNLKTRS